MARRSRIRLRLVTAFALAGALGCKPDKPVTPDEDGKNGKGGDGPMSEVGPVARIAEMLPAAAPLVWEVAGVDRIAEVIDRDGLVKKFEPQYRKLADELVRETGRDFLDPKTIADMGIDTRGRMGFALLSIQPIGVAAFATVKDKGRFRSAVFEIAKRTGVELVATPLGHAEILRSAQKGPAIVIREPFVAFVFAGGSGDGNDDPAFALATMDPHMSLAATKGFKKATGGLSPSDAMFFVDGGSLSRNVLGAMGGNEPQPVSQNWARDELTKARQDNAPPARIKELEEQAKRIDEDNARWARRRQGERVAFEQLMSGLSTSVWTGDAKPTAIVGQGITTFAADSPILQSFENAAGSPPLARALDGQPLLMLNGKANVEQFLKVVDLLAMADGTSWADVSAEIAKSTGIDPEKDLRPLVTGQVGFAIVRDGDSETTVVDAKDIGAALHVEVHDPKRAREVLAKAAKGLSSTEGLSMTQGVKVRKAGDGWVADLPKWRKVYIDIQGPHLVIATDAKLVGRIAGGKAGTIVKRADKAALAAASLQDSAASMLFDPDMSFLFFGIRKFDSPIVSSVEAPEDAKVPKSRAWKAKERELQAVQKKLDAASEARSNADVSAFRSVIRPWGSFGASARRDGNSLVVQGGWFVRAESIAVALSNSLDAVRKLDDRKQDDASFKLFEQRSKLEGELNELRRADIEKFKARKGR